MSDLILHAYDASPFTQRALRLLGLKDLDWSWVETPMMPPKDDLIALTGGYRGTPVLQVGSDIYIDSRMIALELERRYPEPTLFPAGDSGLALALITWCDAFFRTGLKTILGAAAHTWPEAFRKDRESVFPDIDFHAAAQGLDHAKQQYEGHAALIDRQLADGRLFLSGARPGLVDAFVHPFVWMLRANLPDVATQMLAQYSNLPKWEKRVASIGEGRRTRISAADALSVARASDPQTRSNSAPGVESGMRVRVSPDDTQRGSVEGELVIATANELAVRRVSDTTGPVVVHFPRIGYRVSRI
jgi:glutathione S-transferase